MGGTEEAIARSTDSEGINDVRGGDSGYLDRSECRGSKWKRQLKHRRDNICTACRGMTVGEATKIGPVVVGITIGGDVRDQTCTVDWIVSCDEVMCIIQQEHERPLSRAVARAGGGNGRGPVDVGVHLTGRRQRERRVDREAAAHPREGRCVRSNGWMGVRPSQRVSISRPRTGTGEPGCGCCTSHQLRGCRCVARRPNHSKRPPLPPAACAVQFSEGGIAGACSGSRQAALSTPH